MQVHLSSWSKGVLKLFPFPVEKEKNATFNINEIVEGEVGKYTHKLVSSMLPSQTTFSFLEETAYAGVQLYYWGDSSKCNNMYNDLKSIHIASFPE